MTIEITDSLITSDTGVIALADDSAQIMLRNNKIIETSNYIISGTYLFKRGVQIPIAWFACRNNSSGNATITFNIPNVTVSTVGQNAISYQLPEYASAYSNIIKLGLVSPSYALSSVRSSVSATSSVGIAELTQWNSTHDFTSSRYSLTNKAPTISANNIVNGASNTYSYFNISGSNVIITVTASTSNTVYVSLKVTI